MWGVCMCTHMYTHVHIKHCVKALRQLTEFVQPTRKGKCLLPPSGTELSSHWLDLLSPWLCLTLTVTIQPLASTALNCCLATATNLSSGAHCQSRDIWELRLIPRMFHKIPLVGSLFFKVFSGLQQKFCLLSLAATLDSDIVRERLLLGGCCVDPHANRVTEPQPSFWVVDEIGTFTIWNDFSVFLFLIDT